MVLNRQRIVGVDSLLRDIVSEVLIVVKEVDLSIWPEEEKLVPFRTCSFELTPSGFSVGKEYRLSASGDLMRNKHRRVQGSAL